MSKSKLATSGTTLDCSQHFPTTLSCVFWTLSLHLHLTVRPAQHDLASPQLQYLLMMVWRTHSCHACPV